MHLYYGYCGDRRLLVAVASQNPGLRCVGIEIDPVHAKRANEAVSAADIGSRVEIREGDVIKLMNGIHNQGAGVVSLQNDATSVFLYLLPNGLETIKPFLES